MKLILSCLFCLFLLGCNIFQTKKELLTSKLNELNKRAATTELSKNEAIELIREYRNLRKDLFDYWMDGHKAEAQIFSNEINEISQNVTYLRTRYNIPSENHLKDIRFNMNENSSSNSNSNGDNDSKLFLNNSSQNENDNSNNGRNSDQSSTPQYNQEQQYSQCVNCEGKGKVFCGSCSGRGYNICNGIEQPCQNCLKTGIVICSVCNGTGIVSK